MPPKINQNASANHGYESLLSSNINNSPPSSTHQVPSNDRSSHMPIPIPRINASSRLLFHKNLTRPQGYRTGSPDYIGLYSKSPAGLQHAKEAAEKAKAEKAKAEKANSDDSSRRLSRSTPTEMTRLMQKHNIRPRSLSESPKKSVSWCDKVEVMTFNSCTEGVVFESDAEPGLTMKDILAPKETKYESLKE